MALVSASAWLNWMRIALMTQEMPQQEALCGGQILDCKWTTWANSWQSMSPCRGFTVQQPHARLCLKWLLARTELGYFSEDHANRWNRRHPHLDLGRCGKRSLDWSRSFFECAVGHEASTLDTYLFLENWELAKYVEGSIKSDLQASVCRRVETKGRQSSKLKNKFRGIYPSFAAEQNKKRKDVLVYKTYVNKI